MPTAIRSVSLVALTLSALGSVACAESTPVPRIANARTAAEQSASSALGPSYVLVPLPSDDDSLLGRVIDDTPKAGHSLEESSRANPCLDKLSDVKVAPMINSFEDAQDISRSASARAAIGAFGFRGDIQNATHFLYKLTTSKRAGRVDTADYASCCAEKGCGVGYVSALVYGEGQYATGQETTAQAGASVSIVASGEGELAVKIVEKRDVQGWLAALVTITDRQKIDSLGPLGVAQAAGISDATLPATLKDVYEHNKMEVEGGGAKYTFKVASGETVTENEFVRRYRDMTGSKDLDDVEGRRNGVGLATFGVLTAGSAAMLAVGVGSSFKGSSGFVGLLGLAGTIGFGIPFLVKLGSPDGKPTDHRITDADARIYAGRYNRGLLKKTVHDMEQVENDDQQTSSVEVEPVLGLGAVGVQGRF